jgi:hypothetical protein
MLFISRWHFTRATDGGGFEPPVPFGTHAFQACTINHSVTHPVLILARAGIVIGLGPKVDEERE